MNTITLKEEQIPKHLSGLFLGFTKDQYQNIVGIKLATTAGHVELRSQYSIQVIVPEPAPPPVKKFRLTGKLHNTVPVDLVFDDQESAEGEKDRLSRLDPMAEELGIFEFLHETPLAA